MIRQNVMEDCKRKVLSAHNITKRYESVIALNHVSIDFFAGEIHALAGENGAGKSTLIKVLSGSIAPDSGEITMEDYLCSYMEPRKARELKISTIYQESQLIPDITVAENIFMGHFIGKFGWIDKHAMNKKAKEIFDKLGVDIDPGMQAGELSTAKRQMVELARIMEQDTRVLILDEPTAALSKDDAAILFRVIRQLKEKGVSIIYISHRMSEIYELSDRITVMRDGQVVLSEHMKSVSEEQLLYSMIGRKLEDTFPKRTTEPKEVLLKVENLENEYVKDLSFQLRRGEILGIAGLTGSRRTESMELLFGAEKKKKGKIELEGKEVMIRTPKDAVKLGIGYLPEDRKGKGILQNLNIKDNVALPVLKKLAKSLWLEQDKELKLARKYIEMFRIKAASEKETVHHLSGGNQQKVVISKWLASNSTVLIFDEPTQGIDVGAKYEIYQMMNLLTEKGVSILMISSDMEELLGMSDRILVLYEGRISGELKSRETFSQEAVMRLASNIGGVGRSYAQNCT